MGSPDGRSINPGCNHDVDRASNSSGNFFQTLNMSDQFIFVGHARKIPTQHFVRPQRRLTPRPKRDQHTGNDGRVGLQFDAILIVTQQMSAA